ncbi:hypothetical protein LXL04_001961 [Taraxacum kok-saghyz]
MVRVAEDEQNMNPGRGRANGEIHKSSLFLQAPINKMRPVCSICHSNRRRPNSSSGSLTFGDEIEIGEKKLSKASMQGRFSEDKARYFFQQLISGVHYCHFMQICHRDLKLENTLLEGNPAPRLKICDFAYSKGFSSFLKSLNKPKSLVGTPAYIAPEVLSRREYDGKVKDI